MRTQLEIQRAHDILVAILLNEVPDPATHERGMTAGLASVLCWVLEHDHNTGFAEALEKIEAKLYAAGYNLQLGKPGQEPP